MTIPQPAGLIAVLQDKAARIDERDDAAMDLGNHDEPEALMALLEAATDPAEDVSIVSSAGESIGLIWQRTGMFDSELLGRLRPEAQKEIRGLAQPPG